MEGTDCTYVSTDAEIATDSEAQEHIHDKDCGYIEAVEGKSCTHSCAFCKPAGGEKPAKPEAPECDCTVQCTAPDADNAVEAAINADCPVCGGEAADLATCKGEATAESTKPMPLSLQGAESRTCEVTVVNGPDVSWRELHMDPVGTDEWGANRLAQGATLDVNASVTFDLTLPSGATQAYLMFVDGRNVRRYTHRLRHQLHGDGERQ